MTLKVGLLCIWLGFVGGDGIYVWSGAGHDTRWVFDMAVDRGFSFAWLWLMMWSMRRATGYVKL